MIGAWTLCNRTPAAAHQDARSAARLQIVVIDVRPGGEDLDGREAVCRHGLEMPGPERFRVEQVRGEAEVHGANGTRKARSCLAQLVDVGGQQVVQAAEGRYRARLLRT